MRLKFPDVTDPPDVIADAVGLLVVPGEFATADFFTKRNRFQHGTITKTAATDVVNFSRARLVDKGGKCFHQVEAVNVIAHLLAFVTENPIRPADDTAFHQVGKETMQLRPSVGRAGQATTSETSGRHSKIAAIFLNQDVGGDLRSTEKRMFRRIDAHR